MSIKDHMKIKIDMEGSVNFHDFKCSAVGEGEINKGTQRIKITVTEGAPLPFSFDILSPCFQYGMEMFTLHTQDIPNFFKQSFPEGYTWQRVTTYEDGGILTVNQDTSLEDGVIVGNVKVVGINFPQDGPVMLNKTHGWEPSFQMFFKRDKMLLSYNNMALKLGDERYLACSFKTVFRSKREVILPKFHFQNVFLEKSENEDGTIEQKETGIAKYSDVPVLPKGTPLT